MYCGQWELHALFSKGVYKPLLQPLFFTAERSSTFKGYKTKSGAMPFIKKLKKLLQDWLDLNTWLQVSGVKGEMLGHGLDQLKGQQIQEIKTRKFCCDKAIAPFTQGF